MTRNPKQKQALPRPFWHLFAGTFTSNLGTNISILVMPTYAITNLHASDQQVTAISIAQTLPAAIFSLWVGSKVDKFDRSRLIVFSDIASAMLAFIVGVLLLQQALSLGSLYFAVFVMATLGLVYNIATQALVPELLENEKILKGNAYLFGGNSVATVFGQLLASKLTMIFHGALAMSLDGISHLLRVACLLPIIQKHPLSDKNILPKTHTSWWADLKLSFAYLRERPELVNIIGAITTVNFGGVYILAYFFLYMYDTLGLTPFHLGVAFAVGSVASTLGALAVGRLKSSRNLSTIGYASFAVACLALWLLVLATKKNAFLILLIYEVFFKFGSAIFNVAMATRRHHLVSTEYQGRIISIGVFFSNVSMLLAALLATASARVLSPSQGIFAGCSLTLLTFYWILRQRNVHRNKTSTKTAKNP